MQADYDWRFFDWVALTAHRSARTVIPIVRGLVAAESVVDVGCGEGAWLAVWSDCGLEQAFGLDGAYVDIRRLKIAPDRFAAVDLGASIRISRRFELAQSLEVAEHLSPERSHSFVSDLCALSDLVLFSAAQPGQGGAGHVNERKVSFWAEIFRQNGYAAYDCLRPALREARGVDPWYRFNPVLYANDQGATRLSPAGLASRSDDLASLDRGGDLAWFLRRALLRPLPSGLISQLSRLRYRAVCACRRVEQAS